MHRIVAVLSGLFFLTSCITDGVGSSGDSIYYASQAEADAALEAFDKSNPSCQLWTNWQKMCSRTGENGKTWCTTDPDRPVRPSTPFCAGDERGFGAEFRYDISLLARKSSERFCAGYDDGSMLSKRLGRAVCNQYSRDRPFSGYRVRARQHPWCSEWKDKGTFEIVPDLSPTRSVSGLYCSKSRTPYWCAQVDGFGLIPLNSPDHPDYGSGKITVLGIVDKTSYAPAVGIMCRRMKSGR